MTPRNAGFAILALDRRLIETIQASRSRKHAQNTGGARQAWYYYVMY
ncbi:MAG: hypothetical protein ABSH05_27930 [Bryobacteraceae bacterium]|jgi:hypothetical protein